MKKKIFDFAIDMIGCIAAAIVFYMMLSLFSKVLIWQVGAVDILECPCDASGASVTLESGKTVEVPTLDIYALYVDSNGSEAYGWELIEGIRLMMLECGSYKVSEADKREHCAVLFKQLYFTQTVGGYNGWGTTLWGVMHAGNTYLETAPRIWTVDANPTDEIAAIFWDVWCNGYSTDFRVQNYRTNYFFQGEWAIPAYSIGTTYYSINRWQDFSMFDLDENGVLKKPGMDICENADQKDWFDPDDAAVIVYAQ